MNILTLSIKQKYFDEILAGTKKQEYREVRPNNFAKYGRIIIPYPDGERYKDFDEVPEMFDNAEWGIEPVKYDALKLLTGAYTDKRPYLIVEVESAEIYEIIDEHGKPYIIGEGTEDEYSMHEIEYSLGKILEVELYK